ncbi:MAG: hypothetical protein Q7U38_00720 [Methylobacter sp.]|nr:hypothetical protein [Methylobacter sp.]MDP2100462.1 hypothetical protein [Methylobacter sp.]MDP2428322.1 hypothetical protein [Methylobacter sp.]MDP3055673.1 hypothetical protein [Methylobacter sp.]MDP3361391.1 hypothetical protein [Methylobacter sp.]
MNANNDQIFINQLNQHPELRERMESLYPVLHRAHWATGQFQRGIAGSAKKPECKRTAVKVQWLVFFKPTGI